MTDRPRMRHGPAQGDDGPVLLLTVHAAAVWALTGLSFTVQRVVYPAFTHVGPTPAWPAAHRQHLRRISQVVALPWFVQGVTTALLLLARPDGVPLWLVGVTAVLAATTVVLTLLGAVPAHDSLGRSYDGRTLARLLRASAWRTVGWSGGSVCAAVMLVLAAR